MYCVARIEDGYGFRVTKQTKVLIVTFVEEERRQPA